MIRKLGLLLEIIIKLQLEETTTFTKSNNYYYELWGFFLQCWHTFMNPKFHSHLLDPMSHGSHCCIIMEADSKISLKKLKSMALLMTSFPMKEIVVTCRSYDMLHIDYEVKLL